jgi:type I restriction enzyme, R subunit
MSNPFTERGSVQNPIIKYATKIGWTPIKQKDALISRNGIEGLFFYGILRTKLIELNPNIVNDTNVEGIIKRLESLRNNIQGNEDALHWLKGNHSIYSEEQNREVNLNVIDFVNLTNNDYHVTDEWKFSNGKYKNRSDVTFLINGIPIIIVETKASHVSEGIEKGLIQIRRYHAETPEMMIHPQIYDVPNILDFYYGITWNFNKKSLFNWNDDEKGNFEKKVKKFFDIERILKMLHDHIAFIKKEDEVTKIILRQHQTRAVEKVIERAKDPTRHRGLVWHTQGSGKTLTMMTTAKILFERKEFEKPTIIMLIDRNELETQLLGNFESFGIKQGEGLEMAESKENLKELLASDYRGIIISMIHKFEKSSPSLNDRNNVFVLVDEAHRSTSSDLGNYLFSALPNATFIGFTGTPIDRITYGKGTFKIFGKDDEKGYLDKYSISESIEDGTTLKLHYTLAPNEMIVPKELLEKEFLKQQELEGVNDIVELNKILDKAVNLKNFLKSEDRIKKVANFTAKHYKENVEPLGYKAFLVGVDREACILLKEELDKFLPPDYSTVVYSPAHNDSEKLKEHYLSEDDEKKLRKSFVNSKKLPKILIVTEKLLTGFDAPILYCMYLDKPMRDHTLLQAIARVNRPYEDEVGGEKPSGLVIDFVGIFDKLEKALAFDSDVVSSIITNMDILKKTFEKLITTEAENYLNIIKGYKDEKAIEKLIDEFDDKKKREEFFSFFKQLQTLYEIISPDSFLRPFIVNYSKLSNMYKIVKGKFTTKVFLSAELRSKTEALVRESVQTGGLKDTLDVYEIDENTLSKLKEDTSSDKVKVVNLSKGLIRTILEKEKEQPYLIPIRERAEAILENYDNKQFTTKEVLDRLKKELEEYYISEKTLKAKGFDVDTFSIYWTLQKQNKNNSEQLAPEIQKIFVSYSNADKNSEELRLLKAELYKIILEKIEENIDDAKDIANKLLKLKDLDTDG